MNVKLNSFLFICLFICLGPASLSANQSFLSNDTLILEAEKHKGYGLYKRIYSPLNLKDISEDDQLLDVIPKGISNLQYAHEHIDFKVWQYENLKKTKHKYMGTFLKEFYPAKIDTANIPLEKDNTLKVIFGRKGLDSIYILDQNNNNDFRDDSIRLMEKIVFGVPSQQPRPIQCHYNIYNGKEMIKDSSWVIIGLGIGNKPWLSVAHHLRSTFSIDGQEYEVQARNDYYLRFCFEKPNISITAKNGIRKDSLLISEIFEIGEYLQFGQHYYRFEDITNHGSKITFVREKDVSDKIGTQVGFIAPYFNGLTTAGDSISLTDYKNEYLLLVNLTACGSPTLSYDYFKEISEHYQSKTDILAIDVSPGILKVNIDVLDLKGKFIIAKDHKSVENNYREDFCSRVCFLIGPSGHIVDKFEIKEWKQALAKHFD